MHLGYSTNNRSSITSPVARKVLNHVYTAGRLRPPTSLRAVFGTYGILWGCARSLGSWREVVRSEEYARLGVHALETYGIFKVRLVLSSLFLCARLMALWYVAGWRDRGTWVAHRVSRGAELGLRHDTASCSVELVTSNNTSTCCNTPPLRVGPIKSNNRFNFACVLFGFVDRTLSALF